MMAWPCRRLRWPFVLPHSIRGSVVTEGLQVILSQIEIVETGKPPDLLVAPVAGRTRSCRATSLCDCLMTCESCFQVLWVLLPSNVTVKLHQGTGQLDCTVGRNRSETTKTRSWDGHAETLPFPGYPEHELPGSVDQPSVF